MSCRLHILRGTIVVLPEFTERGFAGSARYNLGHVFHPDTGKQRPENDRTFSAIEPLFDDVVSRVDGKQTHYAIYGHSAGAQFVHRFMYYKPMARVTTFIAANAGWYTVPISDFDYPYGLTMYRVAKARAKELELEFNWELFTIKGADHDNRKMAPAAAAFVAGTTNDLEN